MVYFPQQKNKDKMTGIIGFLNYHINYTTLRIEEISDEKEKIFCREVAKILLKCKSDLQELMIRKERNEL